MSQKAPTKSQFSAIKISRHEAHKFINAMNKHLGDKTSAGAEFGLTRDQFRRRLDQVAIQHKLYPKNFSVLETRAKVAASPDVKDAVQLVRASADQAYMRSQIKQLNADLDAANKEIARYQFAVGNMHAPADWTLSKHKHHKSAHIPLLLVSDAQAGEVIDATETEYGRGYNTPIFRERYRELIDTTAYLSKNHVSKDWSFPGIIYVRGGDAISGGIHQELAETDDMTTLEAVRVVYEEEAAGIAHLADVFKRVDVKSVSGGNHDRTTMKPQSKKRVQHSHDALIDYMLAERFKNDDRVTFQFTNSPDVVFPIFDKMVLATHGDNIGGGGGTGFIGPVATIAKGVQKVMQEQMHMKRIIEHVFVGHFHTFHHSTAFTANGSFPGYSEFAKKFRMRPEPPLQVLQFWAPNRGIVDLKKIVLK